MICKKCNAENENGAKFCRICGTALQTQEQPAEAPAPVPYQTPVTPAPNPYAAQTTPPSSSGDGIASMVLGIVSIVLCCIPIVPTICAIIAIILSRKETRAGKRSSCNTAGLVCGIIGLCLSILYLIYWLFVLFCGLIAATSAPTVDFRL